MSSESRILRPDAEPAPLIRGELDHAARPASHTPRNEGGAASGSRQPGAGGGGSSSFLRTATE